MPHGLTKVGCKKRVFHEIILGAKSLESLRGEFCSQSVIGSTWSPLSLDTEDQCSQLVVATLVPSTPYMLSFQYNEIAM